MDGLLHILLIEPSLIRQTDVPTHLFKELHAAQGVLEIVDGAAEGGLGDAQPGGGGGIVLGLGEPRSPAEKLRFSDCSKENNRIFALRRWILHWQNPGATEGRPYGCFFDKLHRHRTPRTVAVFSIMLIGLTQHNQQNTHGNDMSS